MEAECVGTLQQKSKQIVRAAAYLQGIAIVTAGSILYFKPSGYKENRSVLFNASAFFVFCCFEVVHLQRQKIRGNENLF